MGKAWYLFATDRCYVVGGAAGKGITNQVFISMLNITFRFCCKYYGRDFRAAGEFSSVMVLVAFLQMLCLMKLFFLSWKYLRMFITSVNLSIVKGNSSCFTILSGSVLGNFCLKKTLIDFSLEILWHEPKMKKEPVLKKMESWVPSGLQSYPKSCQWQIPLIFFLPVAQRQSIYERKNWKLPDSYIISRIIIWDSAAMPNFTLSQAWENEHW